MQCKDKHVTVGMQDDIDGTGTMLLIELNVAGHRFSGQVPDPRRHLGGRSLPVASRLMAWRPAYFRELQARVA